MQLDRRLWPTGRIVLRDIGGGECCTDAREVSGVPWTRLVSDLRPETRNSFWAFGEAGEYPVPPDVLEHWNAALRSDVGVAAVARAFEARIA